MHKFSNRVVDTDDFFHSQILVSVLNDGNNVLKAA